MGSAGMQAKPQAVLFLEPKGSIFEVLRSAAKRGYQTVVITADPSWIERLPQPYASAKSCVSKLVQVDSWKNNTEIESIASDIDKGSPVAGIYFGVEPAALAGAKLRQRFGLPTPTPQNLANVLDKYELRHALIAAGLSKLRVASALEAETWKVWPFEGDAFFKPRKGLGSLHVKRISSLEQLAQAKKAFETEIGSDPKAMRDYIASGVGYFIEEAAEGELLSVEAISHGGTFNPLGLLSRIMHSTNPVVEMGSVFPYPHRDMQKIEAKVEAAHRLVGFTDGPSHTEVIVSEEGDIEIIDFNPRFVGADVLQSINHAYNTQIQESLLDFALGNFRPFCHTVNGYCCLQYAMAPKGIDTLESLSLPSGPEVAFSTQLAKTNSSLSQANRQIDYIGCYLVKGASFEQARHRSQQLRPNFVVNGEHRAQF